jgi:spermidine synthase
MGRLSDLLTAHGSDKDTDHSYGPVYEHLFPPDRADRVRCVLELGVLDGASLRAWLDYFPRARVIGFDRTEPLPGDARLWCLRGDMDEPAAFLSLLLGTGFRFDLIVDDCSHLPRHQLAFLVVLRQFLVPGGWYVVEDVPSIAHAEAMKVLVPEAEVRDLRHVKDRYDDILLLWRNDP